MNYVCFCLLITTMNLGLFADENPIREFTAEIVVVEDRHSEAFQRQDAVRSTEFDWNEWCSQCKDTTVAKSKSTSIVGGSIAMGTQSGASINYLQRNSDSLFELKSFTPSDNVGMRVDIELREGKQLEAKLRFRSVMLSGSEDGAVFIAGSRVLIGKPLLEEFTQQWSFVVDENRLYLVDLPAPKGRKAQLGLRIILKGRVQNVRSQMPTFASINNCQSSRLDQTHTID